jgi:hypothetical protein
MAWATWGFGLLAVVLLWTLSYLFTQRAEPWALATGKNGRLSTSQLQFLLFTALTACAYVTVFAARFQVSGDLTLPTIPLNMLALMGFSVTTAAGSKGITVSYLAQGQLTTKDESTVFANREGQTDLIKVQMLLWTCIAVVVYLIQVQNLVADILARSSDHTTLALPDIDGALLVLMGVSQGGYLGGKLVSRRDGVPCIESVIPEHPRPGDQITVLGTSFTDAATGNSVLIEAPNGETTELTTSQWTDTRVVATLPDQLPVLSETKHHPMLRVRAAAKNSEPVPVPIRANEIQPEPSPEPLNAP